MLERCSKLAERIRETWKVRFLAVLVSYLIWLVVEAAGQLSGDWQVTVDARGQRALFLKHIGRYHWAIRLLRSCLKIARGEENKYLEQVYLGELASCFLKIKMIQTALRHSNEAVTIARVYARGDLCRRLTERGRILEASNQLILAENDFFESLTPNIVNLAKPSHQVGARLAWAIFINKRANTWYTRDIVRELIAEATEIAKRNHLERRLEQILREWDIM